MAVLLPVTDQAPHGAQESAGAAEGGSGELLLVVEDESALREVTRRILARNGYRVMVAAGGQEAIDTASGCDEHITALVSDVVMPGMQGKEVADRISQLQPDVRVLYMSGYTEGLLSAQGILEEGVTLIEKPFTEASLLKKMRGLLRA